MKVKKEKEEGEHEISINITIAKASITESSIDGKRSELPQVQNYFHCQYKLLPDDKDYVKTDVVTFGMAAKMYGDNDSKVLRTWIDGDRTWIAWTNNRKLRVTQDMLLKLFNHNFELKVWDTKDKVSAKARFDRPKAFRLPHSKNHDEVDLDILRNLLKQDGKENIHLGGGSSSLLNQNKNPEKKKTVKKKVSFVGNYNSNHDGEKSSHHFVSTTDDKVEVKVRLDEDNQPEFKNILTLASSGEKPLIIDTEEMDRVKKADIQENRLSNDHQNDKSTNSERSRISSRQSSRKSQELSSAKRKLSPTKQKQNQNGLACITVPLSSLFTNCLSISNTLNEPVASLEEVIVILSLDKPLLSEYQRFKLNPMVLTVRSANQMPSNGMDFEELKTRTCSPYIKYQFHGCQEHKSLPKQHGKTIKFNDSNVILLGTLDKGNLFEYLRGPTLKIEVHDRDAYHVKRKKSLVFGGKPEDENIFNSAYAGGNLNTLLIDNKMENNYGIAEFDLTELLNGERMLHLSSPIRANQKSLINLEYGKYDSAIPYGEYVECGSHLKIKIELVRSLTQPFISPVRNEVSEANEKSQSSSTQVGLTREFTNTPRYGRIVFIFDYANKKFLGDILRLTTEINAIALNLSSYPWHVIESALSTYKLSDEQKEDSSLDIITGCQVIDGEYHIFILEGLMHNGIKRLWDELKHPQLDDERKFQVLYNSDMSFSKRMYVSLDVDLTRIRLHQPISNIVKQPLLYIRDIIPKNCFQAITRLHQLSQSTSLQSATRNDLFPSVDLIISLAREFGIPLTEEDFADTKDGHLRNREIIEDKQQEVCELSSHDGVTIHTRQSSLDMNNKAFDQLLEQRKCGKTPTIDYVNANIKSVLNLSRMKSTNVRPKLIFSDVEVAHNYSSQYLNSSSLALEKLKQGLMNNPDSRYTYCQQFTSATLNPVNEVEETSQEKSKENWKSPQGFVYPGMNTTSHAKLHETRLNELKKPWRENVLHSNILKPSVDRLSFKWMDRNDDFNIWSKPSNMETKNITIHAAGDTLEEDQSFFKRKEFEKWSEKIVVDDTRFHTHRCLVATEMKEKGYLSSNHVDRKQGLLKDPPKKHSLSRHGLQLEPIPTTLVLPSAEEGNESNVGYNPGDFLGMSWLRDKNCIPIRDYNHSHFTKTKGESFRIIPTSGCKKVSMKPI